MSKLDELERDLAKVINKHGLDSRINMPDYVIAQFAVTTIAALNTATLQASKHKDS